MEKKKERKLKADSSDGTKASDFLSISVPTSLSATHGEAIIVLPRREREEEDGENGVGGGGDWKETEAPAPAAV